LIAIIKVPSMQTRIGTGGYGALHLNECNTGDGMINVGIIDWQPKDVQDTGSKFGSIRRQESVLENLLP